MHRGHHGAVGDGRASNAGGNGGNSNVNNGNYGGNNDGSGSSNTGGGEERFPCPGPPPMTFEEFINIHGRPQHPLMPAPQPPARTMQPDPRYFPQMGGPITMPRNLDQIDYSEYVRK